LVLSNIASSPKIIDWVFSLDPIQLSFDAGTLLFPISYVISDVMTEEYGYKRSRQIVWIGFAALVFSALAFKVGIETAVTPLTYCIVKALKKAEGVEIFDDDTSFSSFKFN